MFALGSWLPLTAGSDGLVDPSLQGPALSSGSVSQILPRIDGSLLVQGSFSTFNGLRTGSNARILADGSVGSAFVQLPGVGPESIYGLLLPASANDLWLLYPGEPLWLLYRLNAQGVPVASIDPWESFGAVFDTIAPAPNGDLYAGGDFTYYSGFADYNYLLRLRPDLTLDATFYTYTDARVREVLVQPDGNLLIAGDLGSVGNQSAPGHYLRLLANGQPDPSFTPGIGAGPSAIPKPLMVDSQGRSYWTSQIGVQLTSFNGEPRNHLVRLLPNGSVDLTFNAQLPLRAGVSAVRETSDGKLLVAGFFDSIGGGSRSNVARLTDSGALDASFNAGPMGTGSVEALAPAPGGGWYLGGGFAAVQGMARGAIARVDASGALDATFVPNPGAAGGSPEIRAVLPLPDGRLLVGGGFTSLAPGVPGTGILRVLANGTLDPTFSTGPQPQVGSVSSIVRLPDGRLLVSGGFREMGGQPRNNIARLFPDGSLDPTFDPGAGFSAAPLGIRVLSDGSVVAVGAFREYDGLPAPGIIRLTADGARHPAFNAGSGFAASNSVSAFAVGPGDRIVAVGNLTNYAGIPRMRAVEILPTGAVSNSALGTTNILQSGLGSVAISPSGATFVGRGPRVFRFDPAGVHDATYPGLLPTPSPGGSTQTFALLAHPDGSVLAGSDAVHRLRPDGTLDPEFQAPVALSRDFGYPVGSGRPGRIRTLMFGPNNASILVGGYFQTLGGQERSGFARLLARPYDAWLGEHFNAAELADPAISGDLADPDGDGIANLLEYAFTMGPRGNGQAGLPTSALVQRRGESALELSFTRRKLPHGLAYAVEASTDLEDWSPASLTEVEVIDQGSSERVTVRDSVGLPPGGRRFLRLRVSRG